MLATFSANITAPITKAIEDDRSIEDIAGIIEEIRMFACPNCGHIDPDHRWSEPFDCLKEDCPCELLPEPGTYDETELLSKIDAIIRGQRV
jgi:hypothetical protein